MIHTYKPTHTHIHTYILNETFQIKNYPCLTSQVPIRYTFHYHCQTSNYIKSQLISHDLAYHIVSDHKVHKHRTFFLKHRLRILISSQGKPLPFQMLLPTRGSQVTALSQKHGRWIPRAKDSDIGDVFSWLHIFQTELCFSIILITVIGTLILLNRWPERWKCVSQRVLNAFRFLTLLMSKVWKH